VSKKRFIKAEMRPDTVRPYSEGPYPHIPYVVKSNHPRFTVGTRLDWGFVSCALEDGYSVQIIAAPVAEIRRYRDAYELRKGLPKGEVATWGGVDYLDQEPL